MKHNNIESKTKMSTTELGFNEVQSPDDEYLSLTLSEVVCCRGNLVFPFIED